MGVAILWFYCRLEREWEEKILKEREQLLSELEDVRHSAQVEMDKQQVEYQQKLQELNKEMESKALHLTEEQKTKLAAELRVKELLEEKQALEEETMTQRHIIHLEQIKTEREARELEEQRDQLMMDLEQEKQRLEEDIRKLHQNKVIHPLTTTPPPPTLPPLISSCRVSVRHRSAPYPVVTPLASSVMATLSAPTPVSPVLCSLLAQN